MSSRVSQKAAAREARLAAQARAEALVALRRRIRIVAAMAVVALALVSAAVAFSSAGGGAPAGAATGGRLIGAASSSRLFAGIPQHGLVLGSSRAPVRMVEFADLQCPYCDEYAVQTLPTLVTDYVRTGKVQMRFENLSFIGPDSVAAGRVAAAAAAQNRLWNFVDLMYLNQGRENSGYVTPAYLRRLLGAVPGLNVARALAASATPAADDVLSAANVAAQQDGVEGTPTFLIGPAAGALRQFSPSSLSVAPFASEINRLYASAARSSRSSAAP
jgi:protein-disulfide isomerase